MLLTETDILGWCRCLSGFACGQSDRPVDQFHHAVYACLVFDTSQNKDLGNEACECRRDPEEGTLCGKACRD